MGDAKALTIRQPWASLIAAGVKTIETREWQTAYRGSLLVHAGRAKPPGGADGCGEPVGDWMAAPAFLTNGWVVQHYASGLAGAPDDIPMPLGAVVAVCTLADVVPMIPVSSLERNGEHRIFVPSEDGRLWRTNPKGGSAIEITDQRPYGDFTPGRYAWLLSDVRPLASPVPAKGRQGLWTPDDDLIAAVESAA